MSALIGSHYATRSRLRGIIAAVVTPLRANVPDHEQFIALARHLLDTGCDGLNVLGTTGEATSFSVEERMALMSAITRAKLPMDRLMVGTGAAAITDAVRLSRHAAALGFAGILLLPPFYYKDPTAHGIIAYVRSIVESTRDLPVPVYLYNFPAMSGVTYTVPLISELLQQFGDRISGVKDSSRAADYVKEVATLSSALDVFVVSQTDIPEVRSGTFAGLISGIANINSADCALAYSTGDEAALSRAQALEGAFDSLPIIPGIKYLLSVIHRAPQLAEVRPPLVALNTDQARTLRERFSSIGSDAKGNL